MGKTSRKILFDFDSLIDTQIGFARFLQKNASSLLADWVKDIDLKTMCEERMRRRNFAAAIIKVDEKMDRISPKHTLELMAEVYDDVYTNHYDELISLSPKIPQTKQIISIYDNPDYSNYMECHLLGRTKQEVDILNKEFPNHTVLFGDPEEKFNYSQYARVFIGSYNFLWHMQDTEFTHITVLSYPDNFELIKDVEGHTIKKINSKALLELGDTNQFELLDIHF